MNTSKKADRIPDAVLIEFVTAIFSKLGVPNDTAHLAVRSLLDASLIGVDPHGVDALDMSVEHLRAGGMDPKPEPMLLKEQGGLGMWDMQNGFGPAGCRTVMAHAIRRAEAQGLYFCHAPENLSYR